MSEDIIIFHGNWALDATNTHVFQTEIIKLLQTALKKLNYTIIETNDNNDLLQMFKNNIRIRGIIVDFTEYQFSLCQQIYNFSDNLPIHILTNEELPLHVAKEDIALNIRFFEYKILNVDDTALLIDAATQKYKDTLLPPFTRALFNYVRERKDTFCTPGHMGGNAFTRTPVGGLFYDFYGPNIFKGDISVSVTELGSLLNHTGPHKDAEEYIAKAYGADKTYIVTNGTSTANKIVGTFSAHSGDTILVDRNCHKSIAHMLMTNNVTPIYLKPLRNAYGIIGGIPLSELDSTSINLKINNTLRADTPSYAVITNSTYDGLFYNMEHIRDLPVKYLHLDSAWVPYASFHHIYDGLHGIGGQKLADKVIFETQSTHKLLAAFSQASMIHVQGNIDEEIFNEAYMMHTSTSPQYSIVASTEIATAMINGKVGKRLLNDTIELAVQFRKKLKEFYTELHNSQDTSTFQDSWFFDIWQPDDISSIECWALNPEDSWHGFKNIDKDHLYLDPIKITLLTPGIDISGKFSEKGIPASLVAKFLANHGIIVEKTGPYSLLFLFSIGIDKTKTMQLLQGLIDFKIGYDKNLFIKEFLPELYVEDPEFYENMHVQDLAYSIHTLMREYNLTELMDEAFENLPQMILKPSAAWQEELKGNICEIDIDDMMGKISANMILPYPPGVPMIMPGEAITEESHAILDFLQMLCAIGSKYPGFETDIHGIYKKDGKYKVKVICN